MGELANLDWAGELTVGEVAVRDPSDVTEGRWLAGFSGRGGGVPGSSGGDGDRMVGWYWSPAPFGGPNECR